ncbi:TPA: hypothetical protein KDY13_001606 [Vibrio parahaemolyticus]|nr:hypothetical protein [Vibrio alginolyticus]MCQ9051862.1 hypothetical protein [Vibrio diabolicus]TOE63854.1 hypothetical protein CGJ39_13675 [Vibrio parahaemolyticus]HBC3409373.1 hypothetical protein [Vibrio parahaemolyticus]HCG5551017.1 hypothetical protein [Vibrio parahaemolyticus]
MNQFMADSRFAYLDPRTLILDPAMQARDVELIKDKRERSAQEIKQESQSKEILEDLRNGQPIRQPITVFVIDDKYYVVDGFHRTGACLKYLEENPDAELMINSLIIENRTYAEAFSAAQDVNQAHGVGVTKDEATQAKFRKLIVNREFDLSVSQIEELVGCSRGQAGHIANGLKACKEALGNDIEMNDLESFVESLKFGLESRYYLPQSCWDSKGFPKIRRLSDAFKGKEYVPDKDDEQWEQKQIKDVSKSISRLVEFFGEDIFREGLRKFARGSQLGISISQRSKWLEKAGTIEGSIQDKNSGNKAPNVTENYEL